MINHGKQQEEKIRRKERREEEEDGEDEAMCVAQTLIEGAGRENCRCSIGNIL